MQQNNETMTLTHIHRILGSLGLKPADPELFFTAHAALCAYQQPALLRDLSGALYPKVAAHYDLEPDEVAQSLADAIDQIYRTHADALSALLGQPATSAPQIDTFLAAIVAQL